MRYTYHTPSLKLLTLATVQLVFLTMGTLAILFLIVPSFSFLMIGLAHCLLVYSGWSVTHLFVSPQWFKVLTAYSWRDIVAAGWRVSLTLHPSGEYQLLVSMSHTSWQFLFSFNCVTGRVLLLWRQTQISGHDHVINLGLSLGVLVQFLWDLYHGPWAAWLAFKLEYLWVGPAVWWARLLHLTLGYWRVLVWKLSYFDRWARRHQFKLLVLTGIIPCDSFLEMMCFLVLPYGPVRRLSTESGSGPAARQPRRQRSASSDEYHRLRHQPDLGGPTSNPFHLAQRCIDAGLEPTADEINAIQGTTGTPQAITDEHVALFMRCFKDPLYLPGTLATAATVLTQLLGLPNQTSDCSVVYLATRVLADGGIAGYVGNSGQGAKRLSAHAGGGGGSKLGPQVVAHGAEAFTVFVMPVPDLMKDKVAFRVAFEQWTIFYVFGVLGYTRINELLVAGSTVRVIGPEELLRRQELTGVKVYVYEGGSLIYRFLTIAGVSKATVYSERTVLKLLGGDGQVAGLTVTSTPILGAPEALMAEDAFTPYFNAVALGASDAARAARLTLVPVQPGTTGPIIGYLGEGRTPVNQMTAVFKQDRSQTFTGSASQVAKWMQGVDGTGTTQGVRMAYHRKQQSFKGYDLSYPYHSPT